MQTGTLTVTGKGSTRIPLVGRPHKVTVRFIDIEPPPCDHPHHHHDHLKYEIDVVSEDLSARLDHKRRHHERQFFLVISWSVHEMREIIWHAYY
jgi:hypothetical protein